MDNRPRGPRRLASATRTLFQSPVAGLCALFSPILSLPAHSDSNALIYSPTNTFWLFLYQILTPGAPCQQVVSKALAWLFVTTGEMVSSNNSAYIQARQRLDLLWLTDLARTTAQHLAHNAAEWLWLGKRVFAVDGSSATCPDTPENQSRWPQPAGQKPGCGFPTLRLVALFCLSTGAMIDLAWGPLELAERSLWRMMWAHLRRGDVILADRGFSSFAEFYLLLQRGIDMVARLHARRTTGVKHVKKLGKGDRLVEWMRNKSCPTWLVSSWRKEIPTTLLVREITFTVTSRGFRSESITIVTTLTDPKAYPRQALIALYQRRWEAELRLRDVKTSMKMEKLRCKSPEMVEKEVAMYWIAYNLVRGVMMRSVMNSRREPCGLSFMNCMGLIREWEGELTHARTAEELEKVKEGLLKYIAQQFVRKRPGRQEPRAVKVRPKNYARLTKPRHEFQEIPHRNRYKKPPLTAAPTGA